MEFILNVLKWKLYNFKDVETYKKCEYLCLLNVGNISAINFSFGTQEMKYITNFWNRIHSNRNASIIKTSMAYAAKKKRAIIRM